LKAPSTFFASLCKDSHGTTSGDSDLWLAFSAKKAKERKQPQQLRVKGYELWLILFSDIWINPMQVKRKHKQFSFLLCSISTYYLITTILRGNTELVFNFIKLICKPILE